MDATVLMCTHTGQSKHRHIADDGVHRQVERMMAQCIVPDAKRRGELASQALNLARTCRQTDDGLARKQQLRVRRAARARDWRQTRATHSIVCFSQ